LIFTEASLFRLASMSLWKILRSLLFLPFFQPMSWLASAFTPLSETTLRNLPVPGADFDIRSGALLAPLLIPRVPGTPGSQKARDHLVTFFKQNLPKWTIEYHNSTFKTPATGDKDVPFVNVIITRDPPWARQGDVGRLALVAHYDSKLTPEGFIGATDSAAPCAMILHAARSVDEALTRKWGAMEAAGAADGLEEEKGFQILFLDGEEAFISWTATDSLYGARYDGQMASSKLYILTLYRSLAETWEQTFHPAMSTYHTPLHAIELFVLLDLLGAANPSVKSYFPTTHWAYQHVASIEKRLRGLGLLHSNPGAPFLPESGKSKHEFGGFIEDDHIPFMARGVEILHLIPIPFPDLWHRIEDDGEHLDTATTQDWAVILTAFVAEWFDLEGYFPTDWPAREERAHVISKTEL
jgi:glutaminyl-peptide cyclotransferase